MLDRRKYLIPEEWISKPRTVCGLMSGTSLDGVDAALAKFWTEREKHKLEILGFSYLPFGSGFKENIKTVINQSILINEVSNLNFQLSKYYAEAVKNLLNKAKIKNKDVDLIGMHGQTVWHKPPLRKKLKTQNSQSPTTLQLGSATSLCSYLGIPVISDFRSADIALGGQGAPLVPVFDKEFLSDKKRNVIALNIGGIANITYLPVRGKVIAFDTGPGNVLIDAFSKKLFNKDYDKNGKLASKGKLSNTLFEFLKKIEFIMIKPPKSTGRELFNELFFDYAANLISNNRVSKEDALFTLTQFTAWSITENIRKFADSKAKIIVSGGGAKNNTLLNLLQFGLTQAELLRSDEIGINSDAKEAICFAYLAWRNLAGLPGNIKSVTGASKEVTLGSLSLP